MNSMFLFDNNSAFIVKNSQAISNKDKVASVQKEKSEPEVIEPAPKTPEIKAHLEAKSPLLEKVIAMAEGLGFMNALVIERDLKLPKTEAEALYREYQALNEQEQAPLDKTIEVKSEPVIEKSSSPTSEQIARFENALMKKREIEARIKELEEELKNK